MCHSKCRLVITLIDNRTQTLCVTAHDPSCVADSNQAHTHTVSTPNDWPGTPFGKTGLTLLESKDYLHVSRGGEIALENQLPIVSKIVFGLRLNIPEYFDFLEIARRR